MRNDSIIALVFLVLSTTFVLTLIKAIFKMFAFIGEGGTLDFKGFLNFYKIPLISFLLLILFVAFGLPRLK